MTWLRIEDSFPDHPKVEGLSSDAFRLHVEGLCYCSRNSTDGLITPLSLRKLSLPRPLAHVKRLVSAGLWHPVDEGWYIHDFLDYNPTREQVNRQKADNRERQTRYRQRATSNALVTPLVTAPRPVPYVKGFTVAAVETVEDMGKESVEVVEPEAVAEALQAAREVLQRTHPNRPDRTEGE